MHISRLAPNIVLALFVAACSDESSSTPVALSESTRTEANPNQPSNAGSSSTAAAGSSGMSAPAAGSGGGSSSPEGNSGDIGLSPGSNNGGFDTAGATAGAAGSANQQPAPSADAGNADTTMSFFLTSRGNGQGGDFGGLEGADEFCTTLATEVSPALGAKTWRAYLSTSTVNARERIGTGPWRNAAGVVIAENVEQLHDQAAGGASEENWSLNDSSIALHETGEPLPNQPVLHDILTGSNLDGTVSPAGTCNDWTSQEGTTQNGHSNRAGGGQNPSSWNSSHQTGCAEPTAGGNFQMGTVSQGGGRGSIYCFAID